MNKKICDVCYYQEKKLMESTWRIGRKNSFEAIRIDTCSKDKNFFEGCISVDDAKKRLEKLITGGGK